MASKGTLTIRILGDEKPLGKSLDNATGIMKGWATKAVAVFAGLGVLGGAVLVKEFGDAMERGRLQDRLAAQLNLTEAEAKRAGKIAGGLYANAYGDSLGQVHDAVGAVMSSLGDLDDGEVEDLTAKALDLAAAFDVDVNQGVTTAGVLIRTGLAKDADQAFDLIVRSMQKVPAEMRQELIPIIEEYAQDFAALGIDGEDAFGLIVEAAQDGRFELDKTADALKELTIRASDMSTASQEAFETIGLDAREMANKIVEGGDTARDAFDKIVDGLLAIEDPQTRANTAIALMGTPLEDLSVTEIPAFLQRLDDMSDSLGNVEGAAEGMGDTLNDNVATKIESFKRRAGTALESWLAENVLPVADQVIDAFEEDGVGGALDKAIDLWEDAQPRIEQWFDQTFMPWFQTTGVEWMTFIGGEFGAALINGMIDTIANAQLGFLEGIAEDIAGALGLPFSGGNAPTVDAPDVNNPFDRPTSGGGGNRAEEFLRDQRSPGALGPGTGTSRGRLQEFHGGGMATAGLAELADKERVLSPRQTDAFERMVAALERGAGGRREITIHAYGEQTDRGLFRLRNLGGML